MEKDFTEGLENFKKEVSKWSFLKIKLIKVYDINLMLLLQKLR